MVSERCVSGLTSGTNSMTGAAASGNGRTQIFLNTSRAGLGMSSAG